MTAHSMETARISRVGFTLLEIMIVVSIIGLLAVLAIPAFMKSRQSAQDSAFLNSLRQLSASMERYAITEGDYPGDSAPGVEPVGFGAYRPRQIDWTEKSHIGGHWDWDRAADRGTNIHGFYAGLTISRPARTSIQMTEIDKRIDDGNIYSGAFRRITDGYTYILQK
jgi:prepilin-type N-terminal cleavage/methylation domain-containing protein